MNKFPPTSPDLEGDLLSLSEEVIVRVEGREGLYLGRYSYMAQSWRVSGFSGWRTVVEWWPMPLVGTGNVIL